MPTYRYNCAACGHVLELFQRMSDEPARECPACKRLTLSRIISGGIGVIFKGEGFYVTDSKKRSAEAASMRAEAEGSAQKVGEKKGDAAASGDSAGGAESATAPKGDSKTGAAAAKGNANSDGQ